MRKSILIFIFTLIGVFSARAYDFEVDGIYYNLISGTDEVKVASSGSSDDKYSGSVDIPATVEYEGTTYTVTSIGNYAFYACSGLTSVTIPNSVTSIGNYTFYACSGLTSVTIPNSVTSIDDYVFYGCSGLTSVTIPNSVTSIGYQAFYSCTGLTSVTIGEGVTSISTSAFCECSGLTSVTIPNSVTSIESMAFRGCRGLTSVTIGEGVTTIGGQAFYYCRGLTSVTIPNSVTSIGDEAFRGTSIENPLYNSKIFAYMPPNYSGEYAIPSGIQSIAGGAFSCLNGLTSVTIPESVTSIGNNAFYQCTGLTSVTIPESVTTIGDEAFAYCSGLTSVTIPNSVTSIGKRAFYYCDSLTSVTIPESVTSIGSSAFRGCSGLTSVKWNAVSCQNFYYRPDYEWYPAFYNCRNITSITFGNQVKRIPAYLCYGLSGLTSVTIGESVTTIGNDAFYGCDGLKKITSWAEIPPSCEENIFGDEDYYTMPLYVPAGSKPFYAMAQGWRKFAKIEEIEANTYMVTVQPNDAAMGSVTGGGEYKEGDQAILAAIPNQGYYFVKWDDGNSNNPRILTVSGDTTITAIFARNGDNPTPNENLETDNFRVYVQGRTIHLSEDRGLVQVYNVAGQCVYNGHTTAIPVSQPGVYIVAVGQQRFKVLVR